MTKATRCCCGRKLLTDGEPLIVNDYQHETPGEGRFCGPVHKHELRDLCDLYVQLAEARAENKELALDEWMCQLPSEHRAFQEYAELKAKVSRLEQHQRDVMSDYEAVHQELDRLGAPRRQDNGFGYLPLGRLRKLSVNECGEGLKAALMSERNAAKAELARYRKALRRCVTELYHCAEQLKSHGHVVTPNGSVDRALKAGREALGETEKGEPPTCAWTEDRDGAWETECGGIWEFPDGGPSENGARYCCRCGREIDATGYAELQAEKGGG